MPDPERPAAPGTPGAVPLVEHFRFRLARLTQPGQTLTAAFSGGLDSTVLLHLLARLAPALKLTLRAAHVQHGLQASADAWAAHCGDVCDRLGVPLTTLRVKVDTTQGIGIEAAARAARHAALRELGGDWLVLAHHRGDQAETLLHRLSRGSGVHGAAAMRKADQRGGPPGLLRPLLDTPRSELLAWAQAEQLCWIEDPSNADTHFSRNFIRHALLAPLSTRFPGAEAALARAAGHFDEAAGLLDELAAIDHAHVASTRGASRAALLALSDARLRNLLRARLAAQGYAAPDTDQLTEALRQLRCATSPWRAGFGAWALCVEDDDVWFERAPRPHAGPDCVWQGEALLHWGCVELHFEQTSTAGLQLTPGDLTLSARRGGERLRPHAARPARDLKTLGRDARVPPWWRKALPVFRQAGQVVGWGEIWDAGLRGSDGWHITIRRPNAKF